MLFKKIKSLYSEIDWAAVLLKYENVFVFFFFSLVLLTMQWRLFFIGSEDQLFLYGDNLGVINNLYSIFNSFDITEPFNSLIGKHGMMGGYPMAEPQNSIFYIPTFLIYILYKLFNFGVPGLYYSLLTSYVLHFVTGAFFVFKINRKIFSISSTLSILGGIIYLGLGWNVQWFGTSTLSYMLGVLPLIFYLFIMYMKNRQRKYFLLYTLSLSLFLFAGGIVNFLFYLFINLAIFYLSLVFFKIENIHKSFNTFVEKIKGFIELIIVAPLLALSSYSVQIFITYTTSKNIFHSPSNYDYLSYFGTHYYDFVGFFIPKFGILEFGMNSTPQVIMEFLSTNSFYVGLFPILILIIGLYYNKNRMLLLLYFLIFFNIVFALGGNFFIFDIFYMIPGFKMFRGNYKFIVFSGIYLSLVVPLVFLDLQKATSNVLKRVNLFTNEIIRITLVIFSASIVTSFYSLASKIIQKNGVESKYFHYIFSLTVTNYLIRISFILILLLILLKFLLNKHNINSRLIFGLLIFVALLDTSINYKYMIYYRTNIKEITSTHFFKDCCTDKTVINDIDKYSQLYHIPEILKVDSPVIYSAMPNKYLTNYINFTRYQPNSELKFRPELIRAAGIDGIITDKNITDPELNESNKINISRSNYKYLYQYNANGSLHNDWGDDITMIGSNISYYSISDSKKHFFTNSFIETKDINDEPVKKYLQSEEFSLLKPMIIGENNHDYGTNLLEEEKNHSITNITESTIKKEFTVNTVNDGLFVINIPYAMFWQAKINDEFVPIFRTNYAFSSVKVDKGTNKIQIFIDTRPYYLALAISFLSMNTLVILTIRVRNS